MSKLLLFALILLVAMPLQAMESRETKYLQQGSDFLAKENYQKAAKAYEAAARVEPRSVEALLGMGISYLKLGDNGSSVNPEFLNQAESALKRALEIDPSQAVARYHLGIVCLAQDKAKEAGRQLELLKPLDQGMAKKLSERITAYKPPEKYRQTRVTRTAAKTGSDQGSNGAATQRKSAFTGTVDLYGADWCPHCREAVRYMTSKGINFRYHKIEESAAAKAEFERLGGRGIPLIAIGGRKIMSGFNADNLERHLDYYRQ